MTPTPFGFCSLIWGSDLRYARLMGHLKESIRQTYSGRDCPSLTVVALRGETDPALISLLRKQNQILHWADPLPAREGWQHLEMSKIVVWGLTHIKKLIFLDADCYLSQPCDDLFSCPELTALAGLFSPLNSSRFVFSPCLETLRDLWTIATEATFSKDRGYWNCGPPLDWVGGRWDFNYATGSQGLLYYYFRHLRSTLQFNSQLLVIKHFSAGAEKWNDPRVQDILK